MGTNEAARVLSNAPVLDASEARLGGAGAPVGVGGDIA